MERILYKL
uniref:Uncharacterized protein n=1 Tax=Arundo donax TaxID=35708 RepID=A0A0A9HIW3_ARUDO